MEKHLLVLDLDETLVHATDSPLSRPEDFRAGPYWVYERPQVDEFLSCISEWFHLAVWTSAGSGHAARIIERLFTHAQELRFVWTAERCTRRLNPETHEQFSVKDFKKIKRAGYDLDRVLVVDDSAEKHQRNYGNLIRVSPFLGDTADSELKRLLPFLDWLRTQHNVRQIDKRNWRVRV